MPNFGIVICVYNWDVSWILFALWYRQFMRIVYAGRIGNRPPFFDVLTPPCIRVFILGLIYGNGIAYLIVQFRIAHWKLMEIRFLGLAYIFHTSLFELKRAKLTKRVEIVISEILKQQNQTAEKYHFNVRQRIRFAVYKFFLLWSGSQKQCIYRIFVKKKKNSIHPRHDYRSNAYWMNHFASRAKYNKRRPFLCAQSTFDFFRDHNFASARKWFEIRQFERSIET